MSYINKLKLGNIKTLNQTNSVFPKSDFPIFSKSDLVWFDNGATTHKPYSVIDNIKNYYENYNSNIHRSPHNLSMISSEMFDETRKLTADYIGCEPTEIVFVKGATEGINFLTNSLDYAKLGCSTVVISNMEHHSNIVPWQLANVTIEYIYYDKQANCLDLSELENLLMSNKMIKVVSVCHVSNVTGTTNPIAKIAEIVHRYDAVLIVDGAQGIPHHRVDVKKLGCDAYVFSSHKLFGPTGVGVVYCNKDLYNYLNVWQGGGSMITDVSHYTSRYADPPHKYEAGTPNIADIIAFGETLKYLEKYDWSDVEKYENYLTKYMLTQLRTVPNIMIIADTLDDKVPIFSFDIPNIDKDRLLENLDKNGVAIRYGHHCAQLIVRYYGLENVFRASLAPYNTTSDVDKFINILKNSK